MGFWSAQTIGCGTLSFEECKKRIEEANKRRRKVNRGRAKLAYATEIVDLGHCYALEYHRQNIITWYGDGSILIDTCRWEGSPSTRTRIKELVGLQLFNDSTTKFVDKIRFGTWHQNYPWPGKLHLPADRMVSGLTDEQWVVSPEAKKRRRDAAAKVRKALLPRLLLGEFDTQLLQEHTKGGWGYYTPDWARADDILAALADEDPKLLVDVLDKVCNKPAAKYVYGRLQHYVGAEIVFQSKQKAYTAWLNNLLRKTVLATKWEDKVKKRIEYPPIKVDI
jgi:hypothetical protein